jgi:general secretion pathway protein G
MIVKSKLALRTDRRRNAFTLLEVLVVVAILVVLASVASIYVFRYLDDAKVDSAKSSCKTLSDAADAYMMRQGEYPQNIQQLAPYIKDQSMLMDPWQKPYQMMQTQDQTGKTVCEVYTTDSNGQRISSIKANNTTSGK